MDKTRAALRRAIPQAVVVILCCVLLAAPIWGVALGAAQEAGLQK